MYIYINQTPIRALLPLLNKAKALKKNDFLFLQNPKPITHFHIKKKLLQLHQLIHLFKPTLLNLFQLLRPILLRKLRLLNRGMDLFL